MIGFFSIKTFLVLYAIFLVFFAAYVYRGDGSREHKERILIIGGFGALNLCLFLFLTVMRPEIKAFVANLKSEKITSAEKQESTSKNYKASYVEGYLLEDVYWTDIMGNIHYNAQETRIEIWTSQIVTMAGKITQIYFLEGKYKGYWGYVVNEEDFLADDAPLGK